jgi:hypothetical protein
VDQLEDIIEEIRRLIMMPAQEVVSKEKLNRGGYARSIGRQ